MKLAAPTVLVLVAQSLVGVAETWYLSFLGSDALAGASLVFPIVMLMTMMSNGGLGSGVSRPRHGSTSSVVTRRSWSRGCLSAQGRARVRPVRRRLRLDLRVQSAARIFWPFLASTARLVVAAGIGWLFVRYLDASMSTLFAIVGASFVAFFAVITTASSAGNTLRNARDGNNPRV